MVNSTEANTKPAWGLKRAEVGPAQRAGSWGSGTKEPGQGTCGQLGHQTRRAQRKRGNEVREMEKGGRGWENKDQRPGKRRLESGGHDQEGRSRGQGTEAHSRVGGGGGKGSGGAIERVERKRSMRLVCKDWKWRKLASFIQTEFKLISLKILNHSDMKSTLWQIKEWCSGESCGFECHCHVELGLGVTEGLQGSGGAQWLKVQRIITANAATDNTY